MKKPLLKYFLLFCTFCTFPIASLAQDSNLTNPIYIAALLVDEPDEDDMADLCTYYGFIEASPSADGYRVFTSTNGTEIRYKLTGPSNAPLNTVEVNNLPPKKELPALLASIGFQPDNTPNTYIKGSRLFRRYTTCTIKGGRAVFIKQLGVISSSRYNATKRNTDSKHKLRKSKNN